MPMTSPRSDVLPSGGAPAARLAGVTKSYGDVVALDAVDLELSAGGVTALLGPNGAGKTTAIHTLLGVTRPTAGRAEVFGLPPQAAGARMRIGTMLQTSKVPETLRVAEHLELFSSYYPRRIPIPELSSLAGLAGLERRAYGKLSAGQQRRVAFAIALCGDPDLLFLDEPTVGMDVESRRLFWDRIRELARQGRTILLTTHYLDEADALAGRIVVLGRGRIVADGTATEIKARAMARRIRCRTRLNLTAVLALPGVDRVRETAEGLEIFSAAPECVVRQLLARDPDLRDLEITGAALEDAFLALTADGSDTEAVAASRGGIH